MQPSAERELLRVFFSLFAALRSIARAYITAFAVFSFRRRAVPGLNAQTPPPRRRASSLLHVDGGVPADRQFADLPRLLARADLQEFNEFARQSVGHDLVAHAASALDLLKTFRVNTA